MNAEFNWWLLIVGLVVGAGLVWYVVMDARRGEVDVDATERRQEATWLSAMLASEGWQVPPDAAERLLDLHRAYLEAPPPDPVMEDTGPATPVSGETAAPPTGDEPESADAAPAGDVPPPPSAGETSELAGDDGVARGA